MIKVNASILEEGLVEELESTIEKNPELFEDSEVALMPDAHKTNSIPVGFTMTVPHKRVAPDFISSDIACGMTSLLLKDYQPSSKQLYNLSRLMRDIIQVDRRFDMGTKEITDLGTLGGGNHFVEIGVEGNDTLITIHSGSRGLGGKTFNYWKKRAIEQHRNMNLAVRRKMLKDIEPKDRQKWLEENKIGKRDIPFIDLSVSKPLEKKFISDYKEAYSFAEYSRNLMIFFTLEALGISDDVMCESIVTPHNYIDFDEDVWVIRKGSIKAIAGEQVVIPINMRDGVILGTVTERGEFNDSLPHGAGRVLSRTQAFRDLELEDFIREMEGVHSPTICQETLDESPSAYKDLHTILNDIGTGLKDIRVFETVFNYKGVE